jgi:hypothetical protein
MIKTLKDPIEKADGNRCSTIRLCGILLRYASFKSSESRPINLAHLFRNSNQDSPFRALRMQPFVCLDRRIRSVILYKDDHRRTYFQNIVHLPLRIYDRSQKPPSRQLSRARQIRLIRRSSNHLIPTRCSSQDRRP